MRAVQVCGCVEIRGEITPFVSDEDATMYSVYIGEPGSFSCLKDFKLRREAMAFAKDVAMEYALYIDDKTWSVNTHDQTFPTTTRSHDAT